MDAGRIIAALPFNWTLSGVTTGALEEELYTLATAETTLRTNVSSHILENSGKPKNKMDPRLGGDDNKNRSGLLDPTFFLRPAAVVGQRGDVLDGLYAQAGCLQSTDG